MWCGEAGLEITDKVLERATQGELHPQIQIIPIQTTAARKYSQMPGPMASTDKKMIRWTAWLNFRVKGVIGQGCPPMGGLTSRGRGQDQAGAREKGLNRHQGPQFHDDSVSRPLFLIRYIGLNSTSIKYSLRVTKKNR